jgi:hypothetical protein
LNPLDADSYTLSNGNLRVTVGSNSCGRGTVWPTSGKWYFEYQITTAGNPYVGISSAGKLTNYTAANSIGTNNVGDIFYKINDTLTYPGKTVTHNTASVYSIAMDLDNKRMWWGKSGTWYRFDATTANQSTTKAQVEAGNGGFDFSSHPATAGWTVMIGTSSNASSYNLNTGQRAWFYPSMVPSGYKPLATPFLDPPAIADGSAYMDVALYTGNGGTKTISGLGFSPDLMWIKNRNSTYHHALYDTIRGATKMLSSSEAAAEITYSSVTSQTAGFEISGAESRVNENNLTYAAWTWDAGSSTVSNTDGSITSQVRANASAGFSIVGHTGTGSAGTVGHGLNVAPEFIIHKNRDSSNIWVVYHKDLGNNYGLKLNTTDAKFGPTDNFNYTSPTSTVFSVGPTNGNNESTKNIITYCFAPIEGYSAFGSYVGTNTTDNAFVHLGFKPAFLMIKNITTGGSNLYHWCIYDDTRSTYNPSSNVLWPSSALEENNTGLSPKDSPAGNGDIDFLSNGFKVRSSGSAMGGSDTYIYCAWAESPFKYSRAR